MPKKLTFLDACVLIAAFNLNHKSFKEAYDILNDPDREFVITDFLKLELLPNPTLNNRVDEVNFYKDFFNNAVQALEFTPAKTSEALELACKYGLTAVDALHLQTAIDAKVCEFITVEKTTKPFFRMNNPPFQLTSIHLHE